MMNSDGSRSDSDRLRMTSDELNNLIDSLCNIRAENSDVVALDNVLNSTTPKDYDPIAQEQYELERDKYEIENDIIKDIYSSNTQLDMEEINMLKASGIHDRYMASQGQQMENDATAQDDIEAELKARLASVKDDIIREGDINMYTENDITEVMEETEDTFQEQETTTTTESEIEDTTVEVVEETTNEDESLEDLANKLSKELDEGNQTIKNFINESVETAMNAEEESTDSEDLNDIKATELNVEDNTIISALKDKDISEEDAVQLITIMNRYKAGEKFKVYDALPDSIKTVIAQQAMENGFDKSLMEYAAKSFINELVDNLYFDSIITEYNKEMEELLGPVSNLAGAMIDETNKITDEKFIANLPKVAETLKETDPERAEQMLRCTENYTKAHEFENIIKMLEETPSSANKYYKRARDRWNSVVREFDSKYENIKPRFKSISLCASTAKTMGYTEDIGEAFACMLAQEVYSYMDTEDGTPAPIENMIYCYYMINAVITAGIVTYKTETKVEEAKTNIKKCYELINNYMEELWATKKKPKKNKRK